ncbi:MAG: GDSL-type esterase/lipase family protein [Bacillota bacterium]|uniref:GDSL family lipase n=1 Tax=Thermanaerosceptrum fracticalcis TaxID=1712410 RepID=A0A7G6E4G8_THEFR|nr:GDSL-type esterase/lipase family protein [Thermanaerosceptrum fracticalcis]QNB46972.1 GDSL family lipase [Thermanaerosceptrum fracticalcis]
MPTIVALGDSITYGYPFTPDVSWVERLRRETGWKVINSGVSGDTFDDMALRLETDVFTHKPDIVILMGGTNDVYVGLSQPRIQKSFKAIIDALEAENIKIIVGIPLPVDDATERPLQLWRSWLRQFCEDKGIAIIDFHQDFMDERGKMKEDLFLDGCHPRVKGYEIMGERVIKSLAELDLLIRKS